ncbi:PREDICTED: long-chain-fatty-acid--CoA ligase 4-like, partial [Rhagoletis zephyria]|uniref:long-chain-fatty-acid--CoA ligase 4-like n=1 Tax=Rhagoletis zephyria TaxID=28612 RepID=UPI00081189C7
MSRQLLFQLLALPAKAAVNAYTWSTLPFYTLYQKPFSKLRLAKNFGVISTVDPKTGRRVYSRPTPPDIDHPYLKYQVFNDIIPTLDRNREVLGIRDVISEVPAVDEQTGEPVIIDGKPLVKVQLADDFRYLKVGEVLDRVEAIAKGLKENLGVKPGDHVMIYADNSAEWFYSCLALLQINAVMVTLFSTLNDSGVVFGINHSDAKFVITSKRLLPKINRLSGQFEKVKSIVYIDENGKNDDGNVEQLKAKGLEVVSLEQLAENGSKLPKMDFPSPNPDDTMLIMYTSGTTGNPKGVIISYRNFSAELHSLLRMDLENDKICFSSVFAGYLPQAHLFGLVMNLGLFISDSKIAFCSPFTLLDSSPAHIPGQVGDLRLIAPEFLVAVPLMLERIIKEIYRKLNERSSISAPVFTYLMDYKIRWTARGFDTPIINRLVCKKINDQFGGRLRLIGVSSAPLNEKTQALAQAAMGVKVVQAYGSTEMA